jgi:hypothetical protein
MRPVRAWLTRSNSPCTLDASAASHLSTITSDLISAALS